MAFVTFTTLPAGVVDTRHMESGLKWRTMHVFGQQQHQEEAERDPPPTPVTKEEEEEEQEKDEAPETRYRSDQSPNRMLPRAEEDSHPSASSDAPRAACQRRLESALTAPEQPLEPLVLFDVPLRSDSPEL